MDTEFFGILDTEVHDCFKLIGVGWIETLILSRRLALRLVLAFPWLDGDDDPY
jgi:hypothetical protein